MISLLSKDNWQLTDNGREDQHERMKETGGEVVWNKQRQLAIVECRQVLD